MSALHSIKSFISYGFILVTLLTISSHAYAGRVVGGVRLTVAENNTITFTSQGSSSFPGGVGQAQNNIPYQNGWGVSSGAINWNDTNNNPTLRMDSGGIDVLRTNGVANINGNKSGSVVLTGSTVLGGTLRNTFGSGVHNFNSVAATNSNTSVTYDIGGTATINSNNPNIAVSMTRSSGTVVAGGGTLLTHTVTARNIVPTPNATNQGDNIVISVASALPAGASLMSATPSSGSSFNNGNSLASGAS